MRSLAPDLAGSSAGSSRCLLDRRVVLRAGAALAALAVGGVVERTPPRAAAQSVSTTVAVDWVESAHWGNLEAMATDEGVEVWSGVPFTAVGAHWDGDAGFEPIVELRISDDGVIFSDPFWLSGGADEGRPTRDARRFTPLVFTGGGQVIRYRVLDAAGTVTTAPGFALTFIDGRSYDATTAVGGVYDLDYVSTNSSPPAIVSRAGWGANESYRFSNGGEIWPPTYTTVEHVIIHHTATAGDGDPAAEIRSIYYYHAVTKGWGDIAYNYLVDRFGTIYEGRAGGQDVVGGHSYQYQDGSSGIALLGNFSFADVPAAGQAAIVAIVAWVARDLDPFGTSDFWGRSNLPSICGHRDVDDTTECPGGELYADLETIREYVAAAIAEASSVPPAGLVIGDAVQVVTDDGGPLRVRDAPSVDGEILGELANGSQGVIEEGPLEVDGYAWYRLESAQPLGWAVATYLLKIVPDASSVGRFRVGDSVAVAIVDGNLRDGPGLDFSVAAELPRGTPGLVIVGPRVIDGYIWYQLDTPVGIGWMAESVIAASDEMGPPDGAPALGDTVYVVTDWLRLRGGSGITYDIVTVVPEGTIGTVIGGPRAGDGHAWYRVETAFGTGWGAAEYLSRERGVGGSIQIGRTALVATDALRVRNDPTTNGEIVDVVLQGGRLDVLGGPVVADGYTWWNVATGQGSKGWCVGVYLASE